ncbi:MAG: chromosome segregation protein SMC [Desulfobacterales bacterium]|nr:chromosome segregation protein SMC [Desulfobacterales bacterium]
MKIKKISILGFKSFLDRSDILFPVGISGIVGPNGCGKSNIVDAIRWCMGEQSPRQLRGRRMEDVIFNGAGDYKPLGMAEVALHFENGDGSFPDPFKQDEELSVTRRLFRSGESEYRINNVPCRLKDIQDIFMDTGLGTKAYSIIGQGQIGAIVEQRPEETRVMLEEAAGVTKYRKKVGETKRKIERANANLQRVEDIIAEVERQMRSLKYQASKAKRYKTISEKIQNLGLILYANNYHQLKEESGNKLRSTEDLKQQEIAMSIGIDKHNAQITTIRQELEEKDNGLSGLRMDFDKIKERIHKKEGDLGSLSGEIRMQEDLVVRLKEEKGEIRQRLTDLKDDKSGLQQKIEEMKTNSIALEGEISLKEKTLRARRELVQDIKEGYEKARSELSADENKEVGLSRDSEYLNKMLNQITDSRSRLENELKDSKVEIETVLKASERKQRLRETIVEKLHDIEASIEQRNASSEELELIRNRVETELKSAEAKLNVCETRLAGLRSLTENFEGYQMGVRTIMKAKDLGPNQNGRVLGILADVIQVDAEYEMAVEAVLADKLQYVIVETQEDGKQAVDYLRERKRGRGSFIPLRDIKGKGKGEKRDPRFPLLKELVKVPETYSSLVNVLLEDTVLVKDLEEAISVWKDMGGRPGQNGNTLCLVTVQGDIVDQRGVISGGKPANTASGLLARKREMAELKKQSADCAKEVEGLELKLENIIMEIEQKKAALDGLTEERWACKEEINEFDKMLFRFSQELGQLEELSRKMSEDLDRKSKEQGRHKEKLSRIEEELLECKEKHRVEEEYFRKKEMELKESEEEYDQIRDELERLRGDHRIFGEEQRSLSRETERLDDYANDSTKRLEKIDEEISLCHSRTEECRKRGNVLKERLEDLYTGLKRAEEGVNSAERERQTIQDSLKVKQGELEQLREEKDALREKINRADMENSEIQFKVDNLVEVVKEKYDLNLTGIYEQYLDEDFSRAEVEERLERQKTLKQRLGEVNLTAIKEHEALQERYKFIKNQREDLLSSIESLQVAIAKINKTSLMKFREAFEQVDNKLKEIFPILFNGGTAGLRLTDESNPLESGVLVEVHPPGKKLSHMGLLSGGEKALVAMALLFAIYMIKPSPFCLLDEVDAPLDEANINRFNKLLEEVKRASQIIMVTHSKRTMEIMDRLYGVTMEKAGVSKMVSVDIQNLKNKASGHPPNGSIEESSISPL